jgi:hypothetical protein
LFPSGLRPVSAELHLPTGVLTIASRIRRQARTARAPRSSCARRSIARRSGSRCPTRSRVRSPSP